MVALLVSSIGHLGLLAFKVSVPNSAVSQSAGKIQLTITQYEFRKTPPQSTIETYTTKGESSPSEAAEPLPENEALEDAELKDAANTYAMSYLRSDQVDETAVPLEVAPLIYPEDPFIRKIPGKVKVRIFINEAGMVDSVDILDSDPPGLFERAAIDSILETKFRAARLYGFPVRNVKTVEIRFDPFRDQPETPTSEPQEQP